jgi:hypothetical protein
MPGNLGDYRVNTRHQWTPKEAIQFISGLQVMTF